MALEILEFIQKAYFFLFKALTITSESLGDFPYVPYPTFSVSFREILYCKYYTWSQIPQMSHPSTSHSSSKAAIEDGGMVSGICKDGSDVS